MKRLGLPVPDGFTLTTEACIEYLKQGAHLSDELIGQLHEQLEAFSQRTQKSFSSKRITFISVCKKWCKNFHAWNDGYYFKLRAE